MDATPNRPRQTAKQVAARERASKQAAERAERLKKQADWYIEIERARRAAMSEEKRERSAKSRAANAKRRATKYGLTEHHKADDIKSLVAAQRDLCARCAVVMHDVYHVDHIVPLRLGGRNSRQNLQLLCVLCNLKKGAREPSLKRF